MKLGGAVWAEHDVVQKQCNASPGSIAAQQGSVNPGHFLLVVQ